VLLLGQPGVVMALSYCGKYKHSPASHVKVNGRRFADDAGRHHNPRAEPARH
jgi:hypothetical protein